MDKNIIDREIEQMMSDLEGPVVLPDFGVKQYSPLTLAYIGDAVFELVIRTMLVREANTAVNKLHRRASGMVNAGAQSKMIGILEPYFTEEEASVYHRGRNAKAYTHAKNAGIQDYRRATGFEAVCGYLYLKKDWKRLLELIRIGLEGPEHEA